MTDGGGSPAALVVGFDAVLCDLDGVVYAGGRPVPGAVETVAALRTRRTPLAFVTNNAARSPREVAERVERLGIRTQPAEIVTSAQAAATLLAGRLDHGADVLVLGTDALAVEVAAVGLRPCRRADEHPAAVVNGYSDTLCYPEIAEAAVALRAGAWWVATNLDATIPTERGLLPGNGAVAALLTAATGRRPVTAGKPAPPLFEEAARRAGANRPLVVGDRLDTDIAGADAAGLPSLAVLSGVADVPTLLAAPKGQRPTYVGRDLRALLAPYPPVEIVAGTATCVGWRATVDGSLVRVHGSGDALDALRAALAVAWAAADAGRAVTTLDGLPALS